MGFQISFFACPATVKRFQLIRFRYLSDGSGFFACEADAGNLKHVIDRPQVFNVDSNGTPRHGADGQLSGMGEVELQSSTGNPRLPVSGGLEGEILRSCFRVSPKNASDCCTAGDEPAAISFEPVTRSAPALGRSQNAVAGSKCVSADVKADFPHVNIAVQRYFDVVRCRHTGRLVKSIYTQTAAIAVSPEHAPQESAGSNQRGSISTATERCSSVTDTTS